MRGHVLIEAGRIERVLPRGSPLPDESSTPLARWAATVYMLVPVLGRLI